MSWIDNLKVGDKVVVCSRNHLYTEYNEGTVSKITPTGRIYVIGYYKPFDLKGKTLGYSSCHSSYLCNPEDEYIKQGVQMTKVMRNSR